MHFRAVKSLSKSAPPSTSGSSSVVAHHLAQSLCSSSSLYQHYSGVVSDWYLCTCSAEDIVINMPETVKSRSGASAEVLQSKKNKIKM